MTTSGIDAAGTDGPWDVIVVGAGPVGTTLTILLAQRGHRVLNLERWSRPYPLPRAVHFDDEVARIFQAAGIADGIEKITEPATRYALRNAEGRTLAEFTREGLGASGWPAALAFHQPDLEALLAERLTVLPTATQWRDWDFTEVVVEGDTVLARGRSTRHPTTVRARFVVGADGANSSVREHLNTSVIDLDFRSDFLVIDVVLDHERTWDPPAMQLCDPARPVTIVPGGPGRRRWEFMLLPGETARDMDRPSVAWRLLDEWDVGPHNARLDRHAVYTFAARWADPWTDGPVILAGDAAHQMPPFFAQGMCAGIRDAAALAWRLDGVLDGRLSTSVLDSYGPERLAHVRTFIDRSVLLGSMVCITDPAEAAMRDELLAAGPPPDAPPLDAPPLLGPGLSVEGSAGAADLLPQGNVTGGGRTGLFDDVVGRRITFLTLAPSLLSTAAAEVLDALGGQTVVVEGRGTAAARPQEHPMHITDDDGTYEAWFATLGAKAALVRPDAYVVGTAADQVTADALVHHLASHIARS